MLTVKGKIWVYKLWIDNDRYATSNSLCPQNSLVPNEVPCAVAIRTAKSVIAEVPQAAESSIGALGRCDERNPERDVHKLTH